MSVVTCDDILCADQCHVLMQNPSYVAHPDFLSAHEWVRSGSADTVAKAVEVHSIDRPQGTASAKVIVVGRVMANPRLLKLRDIGNFNDRFMKMYSAKWVIHLAKPVETLFERDWDVGMNNLTVLEERIATTRGVNMLVHREEDGSVNLRMSAPCFLSNTVERPDVALERYIPKVEARYQSDMRELNPWWKLNVLKIKNAKGDVLPPGEAQELSMRGSLVEVIFTIKHYFINTSHTDSFSALIDSARIMVSGLRREEAEEAYEAYKSSAIGSMSVASGSLSKDKEKDMEERTAMTLTSGSEDDGCSDGHQDKSLEATQEDHEEDNRRKRKGRGIGSERSAKKGKTTV